MKKRIKALFMALVMVLSTVLATVSDVKVVKAAGEGVTVVFHYSRPDGEYSDWSMWIWGTGDGTDNAFTGTDDNGAYLEYAVPASTTKLGYIVRTQAWDKDPDGDRYLDLSQFASGVVEVYCVSGTSEVTVDYSKAVKGCKILSAKATNEHTIDVTLNGETPDFDLTTAFGLKGLNGDMTITNVDVKTSTSVVLTVEETIDFLSAYELTFAGNTYPLTLPDYMSTDAFESKYMYTGDDLGANWTSESTTFKVWAPLATEMNVKLYEGGNIKGKDLIESIPMSLGEQGVWSVTVDGDLNGKYYTYEVTVNGNKKETIDPYAKACGVNGDRGMVINLDATDPEGWENDKNPHAGESYTDAVIYELHVRDFSYDESSGMQNKGKYLAFTEKGTKNSAGLPTGIDYLKDLGITHVHILPSYDYATVNENNLDKDQFNWGYDPKNYNIPEGSYSTDPTNGAVRVNEYKQMVQALHNEGISVVMDVVYNHVYSADSFSMNVLTPGYFSRPGGNGSGCGNDTASERAMVRKYIVDSVVYWAKEYHINGFRFDLSGLIDVDTLNQICDEVHKIDPSIIMYGEGWSMDTPIVKDVALGNQGNADKLPTFAFFNDTMRDQIKGGVFNDLEPGFVNGMIEKGAALVPSITGEPVWAYSPIQSVNYVSCHDNYSLFDKLQITCPEATLDELVSMNKLAAAVVITSQGIPLFQAGEEILRTKEKEDGTFDHNSYASPSSLNSIKYDDLNKAEYKSTYDFYKGLIEFRKNHAAMRMTNYSDISKYMNVYRDGTGEGNIIAYTLSGDATNEVSDGIVVIFNGNKEAVDVEIPEGEWKVCAENGVAGTDVLGTVSGGKVSVYPSSCTILVQGATKMSEAGETPDTPSTDVPSTDVTTEENVTTAGNEAAQTGDSASHMAMVAFVAVAFAAVIVVARKKRFN